MNNDKTYNITLTATRFPEYGVEIALKHDFCSCGCKKGRVKKCTKFIVRAIGDENWTVVNPRPNGFSHYNVVPLHGSEIPNYSLPITGRA